jgi:hypothetical protein
LKSMLWQHGLRRSGKGLCIAWCITSMITVSIGILLCEKMLWRVRNGHAEVRTSGMRKTAPVLAVQICLQRYAKVMMRTQWQKGCLVASQSSFTTLCHYAKPRFRFLVISKGCTEGHFLCSCTALALLHRDLTSTGNPKSLQTGPSGRHEIR